MAQQEHYSLRWNNHQSHILRAFDSLLKTKTLVDVTLVCSESSIRAHKVVLSACSPFFERVFSETPCKHPVIVLKDFRGWVVQAIVDFMYRGEISVPQERLQTLIHAGESLQVRGLVDHPVVMNTPTPAESPDDFSILDTSIVSPESPPLGSPNFNSSLLGQNSAKLLIPSQVFADPGVNMRDREHCTSPTPRRKQARPRRRSGECGPHDLSKPTSPSPAKSDKSDRNSSKERRDMDIDSKDGDDDKVEEIKSETEEILDDDERPRRKKEDRPHVNDTPENLCTKKSSSGGSNAANGNKNNNNDSIDDQNKSNLTLKDVRHRAASLHRTQTFGNFPPFSSLTPPPSFHLNNNPPSGEKNMKAESEDGRAMDDDSMMEPLDIPGPHMSHGPIGDHHHRMGGNRQDFGKHGKEFLPNPLNFHPHFNQGDGPQRHPGSPLPFPPMPSVSALALTSPHNAPFGLFPPGMDPSKMYNPLMELSDPRTMHPDHPPPSFLKKKCELLSRAKSQHSAPRGGPPRSWTNAELTKALEHVWNKKMTTSQASRIFGIPYNSLLMYVRGKYGKSLKLEQLRKDCISGPPIEIIQRGISGHVSSSSGGGGGGSSKDRGKESKDNDSREPSHNQHGPRSSSSEPDLLSSPNPFFGSFPPGFYPDFSEGFPRLPLDMSSLLTSDRHPPQMPINLDDDCRSNGSKQSTEDDVPLALKRDDAKRESGLNTSTNSNQPLPMSKPCVRL